MKRILCLLCVVLMFAIPVRAEGEYPGKSGLLMEASTGKILYASNEHEALAPASVTKVMTLLLIMEAIDSGSIRWTDMVTASERAAAKGGSQVYLKVGESMSVEDMVKSIAVSSANDCACAMAELLAGSEAAFVEKMNQRATELGMTDTHFVNCTGLDDAPEAESHKTSAHDIALMSRELLVKHPDIKRFTTIWMDSIRDGTFGLSNTNKLVRFYNGATGLKTGFTHGAGYCLSASAERDGMELIAVVMGAESSQARFDACRGMLDYGFANYGLYHGQLEEGTQVPVRLGTSDAVAVEFGEEARLLTEKGKLGSITSRVQLLEEVTAPVSRGQRLGEMILESGGEVLSSIPLVAAQDVNRLSWLDIFVKILGKAAMAG